ncbi:hypothetical protein J7E97_09065 [Streptomyces sp. ISL-66]|uniref:hypothetical protein n=1 Tax=Streptomyces sp. ISL-66 TaxID=2819186 RepID=UPI001BEA1276|nr:hypothetical protein [Streptomyces sp. ISL-66]MBT2468026.1 hypothetical protein [Streptomyces sp. ISL-66]
MSHHPHDQEAIECLMELRTALSAHGITLPSLDLHLLSYSGRYASPPLIALGNCNLVTARRLVAALAGER